MFQNENGLTASHWQAKSCFKQAIGEDTKGKLMDEIRGDEELMIFKIIKPGWIKLNTYSFKLSNEDNLSIGINPDPRATAKA